MEPLSASTRLLPLQPMPYHNPEAVLPNFSKASSQTLPVGSFEVVRDVQDARDGATVSIPFIRAAPPSLRLLGQELEDVEKTGIFTNYGPANTRFERLLEKTMFGGRGSCVTVCNATIGLMMAMRAVIGRSEPAAYLPTRMKPRYALMPSFTFAAAAQAAEWIGLIPLFCDVDEADWAASAAAEEALIAEYGDSIAVIVPYATFGNCIDLDRYQALSTRTGIPVVVDAAASLGSLDSDGKAFAADCPFLVVFSMHATKTFSTAEGGVIHSTDTALIETIRVMGNFGFGAARTATMPGLNSKLSEIGALLALAKLEDFEVVVCHRELLATQYRRNLDGWIFQRCNGQRRAYQFMPLLIPATLDGRRDEIISGLKARGIGAGAYFSPHVAEQPFFRQCGRAGDLSVTDRLSRRMLSLPIWDAMSIAMVNIVCDALRDVCDTLAAADVLQPHPVARTSAVGAPRRKLGTARRVRAS